MDFNAKVCLAFFLSLAIVWLLFLGNLMRRNPPDTIHEDVQLGEPELLDPPPDQRLDDTISRTLQGDPPQRLMVNENS